MKTHSGVKVYIPTNFFNFILQLLYRENKYPLAMRLEAK